jgi:peptidyl-prolyl cis-trans isomerase A (cyclophilin A)
MIPLALMAMTLAAGSVTRVEMKTSLGRIVVEVDAGRAPATTANFLRYVDSGLYNGGIIHRAVTLSNQPNNKVKIEVIQGRPNPNGKEFAPIPLERTNKTGLRHLSGTLSMARDGPNTATGDFFICIGDQPSLDYGGARNPDGQGFAAFGHVIEGMDVVRKIQRSPSIAQQLTPQITILDARRVK